MRKILVLLIISLFLYGCGITRQIDDWNEEIKEKNPPITPNVTVFVTDYTGKALSGFFVALPPIVTSNMSDYRGLCELDSTNLTNNIIYDILVYDVANTVSYNYVDTVNVTQTLVIRVNYKII